MAFHRIFPILGPLLAASLVACGPVRVRPAPLPTALVLSPAVTTCPMAPPKRLAIDVRDVQWVGRAANHTWVLGKSGAHRVLLRLVKGNVEPFVLPDVFDTGFVVAHAREHFIWVLRTGSDKPNSGPAWVLVDVRDPAAPKLGRIELLEPLPSDEPNRFALWSDRAVFFLGSPGELVPWDLEKGAPIGSRVRPDAKASEFPWLQCNAAGCLSIMPEGKEADRRMVLRRFDRAGDVEREEVGPGVVAESMSLQWGDRIVAAWSRFDEKGLWARQINATTGEFEAAAYTMTGVEQDLQDPLAIVTRNGPLLAWQAARVGWRIGKLAEDGRGVSDVFTVPAEGAFLSAAATDDGIVTAILSAGQDEQRGANARYGTVRAMFVPFGKTPSSSDVVTLVDNASGTKEGGVVAYALGAPDSAAVLVMPHGNAQGDAFTMLLRKPCAAK